MAELVTKQDMRDAMNTLTLRLTVRLGGIMASGIIVIGVLSLQ